MKHFSGYLRYIFIIPFLPISTQASSIATWKGITSDWGSDENWEGGAPIGTEKDLVFSITNSGQAIVEPKGEIPSDFRPRHITFVGPIEGAPFPFKVEGTVQKNQLFTPVGIQSLGGLVMQEKIGTKQIGVFSFLQLIGKQSLIMRALMEEHK